VDRVERIDPRSEGPGWVLPVAAGERPGRRGGRERQEAEPHEPRSRRFRPAAELDEAEATVASDGHVDVSA
jgi:hypothetical protein